MEFRLTVSRRRWTWLSSIALIALLVATQVHSTDEFEDVQGAASESNVKVDKSTPKVAKGRQTYGVPPIVKLVLRLFTYAQLFGLAWMIMGGENLFRLLGYKDQLPRIYWQAQESWFPIMMFVYFLGPSMVNSFR